MLKSKLAAGLLILILLVSACAGRRAEPAGFTVVVPQWYTPDKVHALKLAVERWNGGHPQSPVTVRELSGKREALLQKILLDARRPEFGDAVLVRNEWLGRLAVDGLIAPCPAPTAVLVRRDALPALQPALDDGRQVWAVPFDADALVVWLREDLLAAHDPQWATQNWDQDRLAALATALTVRTAGRAVRYGFAFPAARATYSATSFLAWYVAAGGEVIDPAGRLVLDVSASTRALSWLQSLVTFTAAPPTVASLEQADVFNGLAGGAYAMTVGGSWERPMFARQSALGDRLVARPLPGRAGQPGTTLVGGWSLVQLVNHRTIPAEFFALLLAEKAQTEKLKQDRLWPVNALVLRAAANSGPDAAVPAALAAGRSLPFHPALAAYLDEVATMVATVFLGEQTPADAAAQAAANITKLPPR